MLRLFARSIAASADWNRVDGIVHSVHKGVCNVSAGGRLTGAIVTAAIGNIPQSVVIVPPENFAFTRFVAPGMAVSLRQGVLRIGHTLSIDLRTARLWQDAAAVYNVDLREEAQLRAWTEVWTTITPHNVALLDRLCLQVGLDGIKFVPCTRTTPGDASVAISPLLVGRRIDTPFDKDRQQWLFWLLIGAGPGLTPAGDDLLVGYFAGLYSAAHNHSGQPDFTSQVADLLHGLLGLTNPVSQFFLLNAANGLIAQRLKELVGIIAEGAYGTATRRATDVALAVGVTSGYAGVLGLLLGLAAWSAPHPVNHLQKARYYGI